MSLQEPQKKMSKSDANVNSYILILDDKDTIIRKFKRAVTDSDALIKYREGADGINNLLSIYSAMTAKSVSEAEKEFDGMGYGDFKLAVGEAVADALAPIKSEHERILADKQYIEKVCAEGAASALSISGRTLRKVYKRVGFVEKK